MSPSKKKKRDDPNQPADWRMTDWKLGDHPIGTTAQFTAKTGLIFDVPDNANELFLFENFFSNEMLDYLTRETNSYADEFLPQKLGLSSDFKRWPVGGVTSEKMRAFLGLTFYFRIVKKSSIKSYWSLDEVTYTPFPRTVMSRVEFYNIMSFLHCCDSQNYVSKEQQGYDPRKKLRNIFPTLQANFRKLWIPNQFISINEGTIPFKRHIHFKVYNPNKPDKYGIKTFKLCDSTNAYCCYFDMYVGETNEPVSNYGKTYDLVMRLLECYKNQGHTLFMDNYYTSLYLMHNLLKSMKKPPHVV